MLKKYMSKKVSALFALSLLGLLVFIFKPFQFAQSQTSTSQSTPQPTPQPIPTPQTEESSTPPLKLVDIGNCSPRNTCLGWDKQLFKGHAKLSPDREGLITAVNRSLSYLETDKAIAAYENYPIPEITRERVIKSLQRFREILINAKSPAELQDTVRQEFAFYKSVGGDNQGTVKFTAYYEPIYEASRVPTAEYKYPIYKAPEDFDQWTKPHPTREELEGTDGLLGKNSRLSGLEMFWLRDRFQAYLIHVQGSAQLKLTDGTLTSVSFTRGTDYPWTSTGKQLFEDGKLTKEELNMPAIIRHFQENPKDMDKYLPRWERFIFFKESKGKGASGSIGVPLIPERSIATDKSIMPPGALAIINGNFPYPNRNDDLVDLRVSRFVLDQDTGSAIKTPGRVDYFLGSGDLAGDRAGVTVATGSLYYLLLKE